MKGKIGILIEEHFDEHEFKQFNEFFPAHGYAVEYLSHLWHQPHLTFKGNDHAAEVTVRVEVSQANPADYRGIILIGGYAMDRLRYEEHPRSGQRNTAPGVEFLRRAVQAMDQGHLPIGTVCHSLWLFCADPDLLRGRKVTCAHNIVCDVQNAGGIVMFAEGQTQDICVDGGLVSGRHPGVVEEFLGAFLREVRERTK